MNFFSDLTTDEKTGLYSHTKFWSNVAYTVSTMIVIWLTYKEHMTSEILLVYLGVVGASQVASKFLSFKYGTPIERSGVTSAKSE